MPRKGEERERWSGHGATSPGAADERPGDEPAWIDPGHLARGPRLDPFARRRHLGPKGYRRPDDRIRDDVCERIARSGLDAREVEVAVEHGEVTLSGAALSREDKRALEDVVDDVYGVEDVHNRLHIPRAGAAAADVAGVAPPALDDRGEVGRSPVPRPRGRGRRRAPTH